MLPDHDVEVGILRAGLPGADVFVVPVRGDIAPLLAEIADADALITAFLDVGPSLLQAAPRLRCIAVNATGYDAIDLVAAREREVAVLGMGEYCTQQVAEHTIALIMALHRSLKAGDEAVTRDGEWSFAAAVPRPLLSALTLGIVGLGRIGSQVARLARALGMRVIATDPAVDAAHAADVGAALVDADDLLARADVITNHMNATPDNRGYFDARAFAAMARRPLFINTARGSAVVEPDLVAALDAGQVAGAGLDVLASENPTLSGHQLAGRRDVIITPHAAFVGTASLTALRTIPATNVVHWLRGEFDQVTQRLA